MIRMNKLPASTFNHLHMNESVVDHDAGEPVIYEISEDKRLDIDEGGDKKVNIAVPAGQSINVVMSYGAGSTQNVETYATLGKGSTLKLIQTRISAGEGKLLGRLCARLDESSRLEVIQIYLPGGEIYSDLTADLIGDESSVDISCAYFAGEDAHIDMNYVVNHTGKRGVSNISVNGALNENAFKLFKGTIDFRTGSSGSKGDEREKVILLDENVINQSLPVILCTEEDVEGAHGAAIGSIDEDVLFYMQSRGISPEDARKLVIYGMFDSLLAKADDTIISEKVQQCLQQVRL